MKNKLIKNLLSKKGKSIPKNKSLWKIIIPLVFILTIIISYFTLLEKPQTAAADWFDDSWLYRQTVAITNSGTNQTDFQVMITLDSATLITANKVQSDCDDIRITDINGKLIPHWIEPSTCNTSATKIWTKVPSITTNGATLYLYYGNSAINSTSLTTDTFIREISGVQGAWDMDEASANTCTGGVNDSCDSSGNDNDGAWQADATNTTGKFGNGVVFDGTGDYIDAGNDSSLDITDVITLEAWVNPNSISGSNKTIVGKEGKYKIDIANGGYIRFLTGNNWGGTILQTTSNVSVDNWNHIIATYNGIIKKVYINGTLDNTTVSTSGSLGINTTALKIGMHTSEPFSGSIDSTRVYNTVLSATEISDLYGTGGDRQGYVTSNYPNKSLVRKYSASVSVGSPASEERGPGPVAYWKFDEGFGQTANDSTINANAGTLGATSGSESSDPTWQNEEMCVSGKCLKFDGSDDYVDAGNDSSLDVINDEITLEAWVKSTTIQNVIAGVFVSKGDAWYVDNKGYGLGIRNTDGSNQVYFGVGNGTGGTWARWAQYESIMDGKWHHISGVYDGSTLRLYVDGIERATASLTGNINSDTENVRIGGNDGVSFNGSIDGVKIYPYARTAAQIKADYASRGTASGTSAVIGSGAKKSLSDGLVGYWKMDEASWDGTADEVVDASGAGNDGVAVGATGIPTTGAGKFGNGGVFDGVDDYVSIADDDSLDITNNFTIGAWIYHITNTGYFDVITQRAYLYYFAVNEYDKIHISGTGLTPSTVTTTDTIPDNSWRYVTATYNGSTLNLYINGTLSKSASVTGSLGTGAQVTTISQDGSSGFNGSIDQVRIYNRALSPGEVRDLYSFAPGPVAHWKMDEKVFGDAQTLNDISGNDNAGTTNDGVNDTGMDCMVQGKYGSACQFDGVDDYVDMGNDASLDITNAITIGAWIKTNEITESYRWITSKGVNKWELVKNIDYIRVEMKTVDGVNRIHSPSSSINANEWTHIVYTYDQSNHRIYINAENQSLSFLSGPFYGDLDSGSQAFTIANRLGDGRFFNGIIDDVRIYNYARTQAQILEDYSGGRKQKQPIGYWKFDEGYSTTANNSGIGGTALNGTVTNMASPATSTSGWTDSGKIGKGLVFDGSDDYVAVGSDASLDITNAITIEAWFYQESQAEHKGIISKWGGEDSKRSWYLLNVLDTGESYIRMKVQDTSDIEYTIQNPSPISLNVWYHVVGVYNGSDIILYVNGTEVDSASAGTSLDSVSAPITIGALGNLPDSNTVFEMDGSIDDVKIYNYALTEDEVREEYNGGALLKLGSTGTDSSGNPDDSQNREYCIPGDTSTCNPPVGRWDFNEGTGTTVNDISGNNNTGTWNGTGSHWTQGKIGKGGNFNGSDDYVDVGSGSSLDIMDTITVEAWVNITNTTSYIIIKNLNSFSNIVYGWQFDSANERMLFWSNGGGGGSGTGSVNTNRWVHVAMAYNKTTIEWYVDGVSSGSNSFTSSLGTTTGSLVFAKRNGTSPSFNGQIDDVRIYDYARTPAQIAWDYNRGKPIAHWKFDECQGSTANDASGNGNNGTITIGATGTQDGIGTCTDGDSTNAWYNGRAGKYNSAMNFDGTDDYVDAGNDSSLDITEEITIEAWVNITNTTGNTWNTILNNGGAWSDGYFLSINDSRQVGVNLEDAVSIYGTYTSETLDLSTYYHLVTTYKNGELYIYINGIIAKSLTPTGTIGAGGGSLIIGRTGGGNFPFNGLIDEVKIYNYALTAEQIKNEYNQGAVRFE